jgi:hypothetical protein
VWPACATNSGHDVEVAEAGRSQDRQDYLFAQGRTRPGPVVTWTRHSEHTRGRAVDVTIDGGWDDTAAFRLLQRVAREEGLQTLGARDPGHLQLPRGVAAGFVPPAEPSSVLGARVEAFGSTWRAPHAPSESARVSANLAPEQRPEGVASIAGVAPVAAVADVAPVAGVASVATVAGVAAPGLAAASPPNLRRPPGNTLRGPRARDTHGLGHPGRPRDARRPGPPRPDARAPGTGAGRRRRSAAPIGARTVRHAAGHAGRPAARCRRGPGRRRLGRRAR